MTDDEKIALFLERAEILRSSTAVPTIDATALHMGFTSGGESIPAAGRRGQVPSRRVQGALVELVEEARRPDRATWREQGVVPAELRPQPLDPLLTLKD